MRSEFGDHVGLVHGRMSGKDKDAAMAAFKAGETRLLVATTVVEVGVDVPDATIMVIEHAERFGLAQLHQLRGRVGRGSANSSCVLLYKAPLGETAKQRLSVMRETEDGFVIAEEDLKLRGEGELMGTRQSGTPGFLVARLEHHADLLEIARDAARLALARDPELQGARGQRAAAAALSVRARRGGAAVEGGVARFTLAPRDCGGDSDTVKFAVYRSQERWTSSYDAFLAWAISASSRVFFVVFRRDQTGRDDQLGGFLDRHRQFDDLASAT